MTSSTRAYFAGKATPATPAKKTPVKPVPTPEPQAEKPRFTAPKKADGDVADRWFDVRARRLAKEKEAAELEAEENFLKNWIIDHLPMSSTGLVGHVCRVQVVPKERGQLDGEKADEFFEFVAKNRKKGAFALLNRALNQKSIKEYWDAGKVVPGVVKEQYKSLSYSKIGK